MDLSNTKWTQLDDIARVSVTYLNGDKDEFDVGAIVHTLKGNPLWLTHQDSDGFEVISPWTAIRSITVLERRTPVLEFRNT